MHSLKVSEFFCTASGENFMITEMIDRSEMFAFMPVFSKVNYMLSYKECRRS